MEDENVCEVRAFGDNKVKTLEGFERPPLSLLINHPSLDNGGPLNQTS